MRAGRASRTAEQNALFRALESLRPPGERLFEDPFAQRFLHWPLSLVGRAAAVPGLCDVICRIIDDRWPGVRTAVVARTRLIDDMIADCLREPIEQVVILGAGFDSRPYRLADLERLPVFEVDHPDTQAAKRGALGRVLPHLPEDVRFAAVDFARQQLDRTMSDAGFDGSKTTLILWEGTTNYLDADSVDATLRWCSRVAPGSRLLFTYVHRDILTRPEMFAGSKNLLAALERAGERFTFGLEPADVPQYLAQRGLLLESDVGAAEFRSRYYGEAANAMRGHEFYRVALARVGTQP